MHHAGSLELLNLLEVPVDHGAHTFLAVLRSNHCESSSRDNSRGMGGCGEEGGRRGSMQVWVVWPQLSSAKYVVCIHVRS